MRTLGCALIVVMLSGVLCFEPPAVREDLLAEFNSPEEILTPESPDVREDLLARFNSAEEMLGYLNDRSKRVYWGEPIGDLSPGVSASGEGFSATNVQESGVDEADVVKTDGSYIFVLRPHLDASRSSLRIVRAVPADALEEVGRLDLDHRADSLYLKDGRVIAVGPRAVTVVDVADVTQPSALQNWTFDTGLTTSRLIGNKLHLVMHHRPMPTFDAQYQVVSWASVDNLLPGYRMTRPDGTTVEGKIVPCSRFYHPVDEIDERWHWNFTLVATVDVRDPEVPLQSAGIIAGTSVVYVSQSSLYAAEVRWSGGGNSEAGDSVETSRIHKFDLTGDQPVYVGSGVVDGHLLNQYSLGEKDGYLRLACTKGQLWGGKSVSAVYVLGESATPGLLETVGKVEGIAPGEGVYAARFIGDRGFLVTFKKVDPLFTLDMSDPANPRLVGELKVPGYSDYIHLMDANHLLTIGKDAYDMGDFAWYQGVQLSIFDVTNFAEPTLLAKEIIGVRGTQSEANYNPKAFNFFGSRSALAIPIRLAEGPTEEPSHPGQVTFSGVYVYRTTVEEGFQFLGRISTTIPQQSVGWYHMPGVRGLFVGDSVYAVGPNCVIAAPITDPSQVQSSLWFDPLFTGYYGSYAE